MENERSFSRFEWNKPRIFTALPHGEDAEALYAATQEILLDQLGNNQSVAVLRYNPDLKQVTNSTPFATGLVNMVLEDSGLRTVVPGNDIEGDVLRHLQGKYYGDFNALGVWEKQPSYEKNKGLWTRVVEIAEETQGSLKFPFMVQGFTVDQDPSLNETGYGLAIVPAQNFKVISDERLSREYNGKSFNEVDEIGFPLFDESGSRTFYSRDNGLSRAYLGGGGDLDFYGDDLDFSDDFGRVVLVGAEGARENFDAYLTNLKSERDFQIAGLKERYSKAEAILRGE